MTLTSEINTSGGRNRYPEDANMEECTGTGDVIPSSTISSAPLSFHKRCGELITLSSVATHATISSPANSPRSGRRLVLFYSTLSGIKPVYKSPYIMFLKFDFDFYSIICSRLTSATRTHASQEFNHGLVFSSKPLQDDQIFEVKIQQK